MIDLLHHPADWPALVPLLRQLRDLQGGRHPDDPAQGALCWTPTEQDRLERWLRRLPAVEGLPLAAEPVLWLLLSVSERPGSGPHDHPVGSFHHRLKDLVLETLKEMPPSPPGSYLPWLGQSDTGGLRPRTLLALRLTAGRLLRGGAAARALEGAGWRDLQHGIDAVEGEPIPSMPSWLVGRPGNRPAVREHRDRLAGLLENPSARTGEVDLLRTAYHADWLEQLLGAGPAAGPMVSVIIPCHNRAGLVLEAIGSCLDQTYPHLEILVVDDGSDDDLQAVLQPLARRVRYVRMEENQGAAMARNVGIRKARGNLIHFLDADDLLHPRAVERKVEGLRRIPDAGLVFSGADQRGQVHYEAPPMYLASPPRTKHCPTQRLIDPAALAYPFLTSTVLLPRWQLEAVGLFDPGLRRGQDTELFFRLGLADVKAIGIAAPLTIRRVVACSLSAHPPATGQLVRLRALNLIHLLENERWIREFAGVTVAALFKPERLSVFVAADEFRELRAALLCVLKRVDLTRICRERNSSRSERSLRRLFSDELRAALPAIAAAEGTAYLAQLQDILGIEG